MLGLTVALATLGVGAGGEVLPASPRRPRSAPEPESVPFPALSHVSAEVVGEPGSNLGRREKRDRRRTRMELRKRRGWR